MTVFWSDAVRNAQADAWETTIGTAAKVQIWAGTVPADEAGSTAGNTKLAEFTLASDWSAAASGGAKSLSSTPLDVTAIAGAPTNATFYRITSSAGTVHEQGTITATGGGGDMTLDNVSIATGQTVRITGFTKTWPG